MLLRVAIDPEGLEPGQSGRGIGRAFLKDLAQRSVLVHDAGGLQELRAALAEHGHDTLNQVVQALLGFRGRTEELPPEVSKLVEVTSVGDLDAWQGKANLILLAAYKYDVLRDECDANDPEFCAFDMASDSEAVAALDERWRTVVDRGAKREAVWKQVFKPIAERCQNVVVIERELGHVLYDDIIKRRRTSHLAPGGPAWFIQRLAGAGVQRVRIATSESKVTGKRFDPDEVIATIRDWLTEQESTLKVEMKFVAGDFQHQRLVAFEGWAGFQIHQGLQTFDHSTLKEDATLVGQVDLDGRTRAEFERLARRAR